MSRAATTEQVLREAEAAATDAATEARGEALDSAAKRAARGKPGKSAAKWKEFLVDVWITDFNRVEFGIYKHTRNKAKSRQFSSDMDIYAEVIEDGERTGLIGYREELWKKRTGMDKRLVFKLFSEGLNWRASMDLMLARSLQATLGARGLPVTTFSLNVGDHDHMVYIERSANKWWGMPETFSFFMMDEGKPEFWRLQQRFVDVGGDYTLYDQRNRAVGSLNGKLFTIGGKWRGRVLAEHSDRRLLMVLQMFCGMLPFNRSCRRHMRNLAREVGAGRLMPTLEKQEADLYMNPRRVR